MRKTLLTLALGISLCANAQLTVDPNGRAIIGKQPSGQLNNDNDNISLTIHDIRSDKNTPVLTNRMPTLSFGSGTNATISGSGDSGSLGIKATSYFYITSGTFLNPLLKWRSSDNTFVSSCDLKAPAFLTTSDARMKRDIETLNETHAGLFDITPVSYKLTAAEETSEEVSTLEKTSASTHSAEVTVTDDRLHFGFIAQEIQKIYPNLVVEDEDGMLAIDYTGFIPLLVDAYKDLAGKVKEQEEVIDALLGQRGPSYMPASVNGLADVKASLKQNRPNPFNTTTTIECSVPQSVASAFICVYDLQGKQVHRIDIRERGDVANVIDASSLAPGMYIYSLIADGAEIDSKRMIITD